ncbi:MAG: hypothetical protein PVH03_07695, partial [Chloroflexota bacterium]
MASRFDWLSDDESSWEPEVVERPPGASRQGKRWKSRYLLALLFIAISAGIIIVVNLNHKITRTNDRVTADVLATHNLVKQAINTGDIDLFDTLIYSDYENWHRIQIELFRHWLLIDRESFGLITPSNSLAELEKYPTQVNLSPDLDSAEVIDYQLYLSQMISTEPIPILLERSSFYRHNGEGWILAPTRRQDGYWGEGLKAQFGRLRVTYSKRDEEYIGRLGEELADLVQQVCAQERIKCPVDFTLRLLFARDPSSLLRLNDNYRTLGLSSGYDAYRIVLPTPSLIGRPTDESSYQALFNGYGSWIAAILVNRYGLEYGEDVEQLMVSYLKEWGLVPPPMPKPPKSQSARNHPPPPFSFPDQEVLMTCPGHTPIQAFVYGPEADEWRVLQDFENLPAMAKIITTSRQSTRFPPDSQGFLIRNRQQVLGPLAWQAYLWLEGLGSLSIENRESRILLADPAQIPSDPADEYLVFYRFSNDKGTSFDRPLVLNVRRCIEGGCEYYEPEGIPVWSPDQQHTLISALDENGQTILYHGDEYGDRLSIAGFGYAPTWLDDEMYAYIREIPPADGDHLAGGETELVVAGLDGNPDPGDGTVLLQAKSLITAVPKHHQTKDLAITMAMNHPRKPNQWFLSATSMDGPNDTTEYVFTYDNDNGSIKRLTYLSGKRFAYGFFLSENGRYLSLLAFDEGDLPGGEWELHVLDLESSDKDRLDKI